MSPRQAGRRSQGASLGAVVVMSVLVMLPVLGFVAAWGAAALTGATSAGPMAWVLEDRGWSSQATIYAAVFGLLILVGAATLIWAVLSGDGKGSRIDHLARDMSTPADQRELTEASAAAAAKRLGVDPECGPGVPLGRSVSTGKKLAATWESTQVWVLGPRAGKSTAVVIPQAMATKGPVLMTSNKNDLVFPTRGPRSEVGPVWVHDPQGIAAEPVTWWWSPIAYCRDAGRADQVASIFHAAGKEPGAKDDAYFSAEAKATLSAFLLAAHLGGGTLLDVWSWVLDPDDEQPEDWLRAGGQPVIADQVRSTRQTTAKQRDGIMGSIRPMLSWVRNDEVQAWFQPGEGRVEFDPDEFVAGTGTLHLLSKEGPGSARALTGSLTAAITDAAERLAIRQGGRLKRPLLVLLDEAANVCPWPSLPSLYSHYGSRGIHLVSIFQNWSQVVDVWGKEGANKLWSAANVRGVGRGVAEGEFASMVSDLIGNHDVRKTQSSSSSRGGTSRSSSYQRERLLDPAEVSALPAGRAVLLSSGVPPVLLRLTPWYSDAPAELREALTESSEFYSQEAVR